MEPVWIAAFALAFVMGIVAILLPNDNKGDSVRRTS